MQLNVESHQEGGVGVVRVIGELDVATAGELREAIVGLVETGAHRLVLDFSRLSFIDSTGLGVLVGAYKRLDRTDGALVMAGPNPRVRRLLTITALDTVMSVYDDYETAMAAVRAEGSGA